MTANLLTLEDFKAAISKRKGLMVLTQQDCDILEELMIRYASQQTKELQEEIESYKSLLDDGVSEVKKLQEEVERLKEAAQDCFTEVYTTQLYPMSQKGKPKGDDIIQKYFPFVKPITTLNKKLTKPMQ